MAMKLCSTMWMKTFFKKRGRGGKAPGETTGMAECGEKKKSVNVGIYIFELNRKVRSLNFIIFHKKQHFSIFSALAHAYMHVKNNFIDSSCL